MLNSSSAAAGSPASLQPRAAPWLGAPPREHEADVAELAAALRESPPRIPSKYFYDADGSLLFERICELPEYYPTRTELAIMRESVAEMAAALGERRVLIEYGSGASLKTRRLLAALDVRVYVPIDVSATALDEAAARLAEEFPALDIEPVVGDFTRMLALPPSVPRSASRVVYFPGSTIGNFTHDEACELLAQMRELAGEGGAALVGVDLRKDPAVLRAAYDDAAGVTAAFNLNLLHHVNREFGLGFRPGGFRHRAPWIDAKGRIEMHLVATERQCGRLGEEEFVVEPGEYLLTEYSHKYRLEEFAALAQAAGWRTARTWTDARRWFSVHLLEA
jgi:dimethylhistidine N-methyltransferase